MSSSAFLRLGEHDMVEMTNHVDPEIATLFRRADLERGVSHVTRSTGEEREEWDEEYVAYHVPREKMLDRLNVMGFTHAAMLADFVAAKAEPGRGSDRAQAASRAIVLEDAAFEDWVEAIRYFFLNDFSSQKNQIPVDAPSLVPIVAESRLGDVLSDIWSVWYPHRDIRFLVRAVIEAFTEEPEVVLDISDLVNRGSVDDDIVESIASDRAWLHSAAEPILVLTEGKTDSRVLRDALSARSPHLVGYFNFADFEEFGVEGGADPLLKLVRGLAASKITTRIIALFDNDTAGREALRKVSTKPLPSNIVTCVLPDLALAREYPTLGPGGQLTMDVNGTACAIEMYVGETCLRRQDGELIPVRWKNFNPVSGSYQGELEDKHAVLRAFEHRLESGQEIDWSGLDAIMGVLRSAFARRENAHSARAFVGREAGRETVEFLNPHR